jgi:hypothetical protein
MHLQDDSDQEEKENVRVTTLNELMQNLMPAFISEIYFFYFIVI